MSGCLLDTNVVSTLAPARTARPPLDHDLAQWLKDRSDELHLSSMTMMELEIGVLKLGRMSPGAFEQKLALWFDGIGKQFADRIIPVDRAVASVAAAIADGNEAAGLSPGTPDIIIAATAVITA